MHQEILLSSQHSPGQRDADGTDGRLKKRETEKQTEENTYNIMHLVQIMKNDFHDTFSKKSYFYMS